MKDNKDNEKPVAVKLEGCFTEWYSPNYKEPFEDNEEYRKFYEENLIDIQPVVGPVLGDDDDAWLTDDLQCVAERLCADADEGWQKATADLVATVDMCLADGKKRTWKDVEGVIDDVVITPYKKAEMPELTDKALEVFGKFGWLIRERYNAI